MTKSTRPTLTEFLLARIAEDEAAARSAGAAPGTEREGDTPVGERWQANRGMVVGAVDLWDNEGVDTLGMSFEAARHVARWDPARVFAECAIKREVVNAQQMMYQQARDASAATDEDLVYTWRVGYRVLEGVLRGWALVHADHPDYDEEWRP